MRANETWFEAPSRGFESYLKLASSAEWAGVALAQESGCRG
eukprot:SAG11_NODE_19987_length_454_cov_15.000000_1_plen_40_part_01